MTMKIVHKQCIKNVYTIRNVCTLYIVNCRSVKDLAIFHMDKKLEIE